MDMTKPETLRHKLQTLEELGDAGDDVQLLRIGYAAARLEIASLQAQLEAVVAGGVGPLVGNAAPQPAQAQEDAVAQAVAAEREACAQVCESWADEHDYAGAIRARGTHAS